MTKPSVLMVGTGEYTTGYVAGSTAAADKRAGVVGITLFDLRRRGLVDRLLIAGTNGTKFPAIRDHLQNAIANQYRGMNTSLETFPSDDMACDPTAYRAAMDRLQPGDAVVIFTPDDTHHTIALDAMQRRLHVLIAKPLVKTVAEHRQLIEAASQHQVLVAMEVHKRWDPIYADARDRIRSLGDFSFFQAYMSQPKSQVKTFQAWAGKSSDISYYLNSHHIDFHVWSCGPAAYPIQVRASAATGIAHALGVPTEDTITLTVDWVNRLSQNRGTAIYTASWVAPKSDVHSQQRFFYMGHYGEVTVDQAHRGYSVASDSHGFASVNPLFMKYSPDAAGNFSGQNGYGYRSLECFLKAVIELRENRAQPSDFNQRLATAPDTLLVTAILEAGRRSLDQSGATVGLRYEGEHFAGFEA